MKIFPHNAWRAIAATITALSIQQGASAAVIQEFGSPASDPALQNGNIITFETGSESVTNLRTYDIVSIVNPTTIQDSSGRYNTAGKSLANNQGYTSTVILRFSTPVSVFGFNLGGADYEWSLSAAGQSYTFKPDANGNKMNYYGISGEKISSATLSFGTWDWVLIDNLTYVAAVPEPTTWALMLFGFGLTGAAMRRRSPQRVTQALA